MKITTRRDALFAQLQTVTRAASTRSAVQALSGVQVLARRRRRSSCAPPTWRSACACRSRARSSARAPSCCRRACSSTSSARCPATSVSLELRAAEQDVEIVARLRDVPHPHAAPRGLPAASRSRTATSASRCPAPAFVETVAKVARSASRDETRPVLTGILVSAAGDELRMVATDSYRLSRQGDASSRRRSSGSFEANVPARALQELTRIVQHDERRDAQRRRCARTRSCSRSAASCCPRG